MEMQKFLTRKLPLLLLLELRVDVVGMPGLLLPRLQDWSRRCDGQSYWLHRGLLNSQILSECLLRSPAYRCSEENWGQLLLLRAKGIWGLENMAIAFICIFEKFPLFLRGLGSHWALDSRTAQFAVLGCRWKFQTFPAWNCPWAEELSAMASAMGQTRNEGNRAAGGSENWLTKWWKNRQTNREHGFHPETAKGLHHGGPGMFSCNFVCWFAARKT